MRHVIRYLLLLLIVMSCEKQSNPTNSIDEINEIPPETKKWTFLFYNDADFIHAEGASYDPMEDFARMVHSGQNVNYLVLQDRNDDEAKIWYIDSTRTSKLKEKLGEINMGSTKALADFISYAKEKYPAERYILSIYDHGGGCWGSCRDDTNGDPALTMEEMKNALMQAGGVDIIQFSAPCLMGALESVYELRDYTDIYIGSENNSSYSYWKWAMRHLSDSLNTNPNIGSIDLSKSIIENIYLRRSAAHPYESELTMSAIETSKVQNLVNSLNEVAMAYLDQKPKFVAMMDSLKDDITFVKQKYMDVYDFANIFSLNETDPQLLQKLDELKTNLKEAIIAECHGEKWSNAHGLTVYLPLEHTVHAHTFYTSPEYRLDFVQNTDWDELLLQYGLSSISKTPFNVSFVPWSPSGDGYHYPIDK